MALVAVQWLQEALLDLSIWDGLHSVQLEYTGLWYGSKTIRLKLCYGENTQQRREEHMSKQGSVLSWVPRASPAELSLRAAFVPVIPFPTFLSISNSNCILSSSTCT